jgi:hypothetical protein
MEYFLGSILTLVVVFFVGRFINKSRAASEKIFVRYSQSHIYDLIVDLVPSNNYLANDIETQATKHYDKLFIQTLISDDQAYWIRDNVLYVANLTDNGSVDKETAKQVDTMSMSKIELDKIMFIVEKLTKGK